MESQDEMPGVVDLTAEWGQSLASQSAKEPGKVTAAGSQRSLPPSGVVEPPKIKTSDVQPLVKALGAVGTRMASVSPLTEDECRDIAEPSAKLLEMLAPEMPGYAIPLGILAARIGNVAGVRADEYRANRKRLASGKPEANEDSGVKFLGADEF